MMLGSEKTLNKYLFNTRMCRCMSQGTKGWECLRDLRHLPCMLEAKSLTPQTTWYLHKILLHLGP